MWRGEPWFRLDLLDTTRAAWLWWAGTGTYVVLEHLLGLFEGKIQDDERVDVEGDGVRPQDVHEPEELDPEALGVKGEFVLGGRLIELGYHDVHLGKGIASIRMRMRTQCK